jgi:hypothetical protein
VSFYDPGDTVEQRSDVACRSNGSDSNNGSSGSPFATLGRALQGVQPGTRIQLGGGTYAMTAMMTFDNINGTATQPIVIIPEPGANPVFDASGIATYYPYVAVFVFRNSSYVFISGIELKNSPAAGFGFSQTHDSSLVSSSIHDIQNAGVLAVGGSNITVAGNDIYHASMNNAGNPGGVVYAGALSSWRDDSSGTSVEAAHYHFVENHVHESWGECIDALWVNDIDVIGNDVHDCFSTLVYLSPASNARVLHNRLYFKDPTTYSGGPTSIIAIDEEGPPYFHEDNILIANNYIGGFGNKFGVFRYDIAGTTTDAANTWSSLHVTNNVIAGKGIYFSKVTGSSAQSGGVLTDNIFIGSQSLTLEDTAAWSVSNNDFAGGIPQGYANNGNFSVAPNFTGPTDGTAFSGFVPTNASQLQVPRTADVTQDAVCQARSSPTTAGLAGP